MTIHTNSGVSEESSKGKSPPTLTRTNAQMLLPRTEFCGELHGYIAQDSPTHRFSGSSLENRVIIFKGFEAPRFGIKISNPESGGIKITLAGEGELYLDRGDLTKSFPQFKPEQFPQNMHELQLEQYRQGRRLHQTINALAPRIKPYELSNILWAVEANLHNPQARFLNQKISWREYNQKNPLIYAIPRNVICIDGVPYLPLNHRKAGDQHVAPPTTDKHICYCLNLRENKLEVMIISRPNDVSSERNPLDEEVRFIAPFRGVSKIIQCNGHTVQPTEKHTELTEIQMQKTYVVQPLYFGNLKTVSIPPEKQLQVAKDLTRALVKVHNEGILHRDLKPDNIFLDKNGTPHISDFGASCFLENDGNRKNRTGGLPPYIAPEFAQAYASDWKRITSEALAEELKTKMNLPLDVYGMGCILYELFVGPLAEHPVFKSSLEQGVGFALTQIAEMTEDWMEEPERNESGEDSPYRIIASMVRVRPEERITAVEAAARFSAL